MQHILEFEEFINEGTAFDRMRDKDPRYWSRRPHEVRIEGLKRYIDTLVPGQMFQYYTSVRTELGLFLRADDTHIYYERFPSLETVITYEAYYLKSVNYRIDKIGGIGAPDKGELEDMEEEYDDAIAVGAIDIKDNYAKEWYAQLKKGISLAVRYK